MRDRIRRVNWRSALDVVTSVAVVATAVILIYNNMSRSSSAPRLEAPRTPLSIEGAQVRGSATAKSVLIVYSDFQCPFCGRFARDVMPEIERRYVQTGEVVVAFRHLPLSIHAQAVRAAVMAECAGRQGRFWEVHDLLFAQTALDDEVLAALPDSVSLNRDHFQSCLLDKSVTQRVRQSAEQANALGIRGTPAFFFGKRLADGRVNVVRAMAGSQPAEMFAQQFSALTDGGSRWTSWIPFLRRPA